MSDLYLTIRAIEELLPVVVICAGIVIFIGIYFWGIVSGYIEDRRDAKKEAERKE